MKKIKLISILVSVFLTHTALADQYAWDSSSNNETYDFTSITGQALDDYGDFLLDTRESANLKATGNICPNYNNMNTRERKEFYIALVAEIAKRESGFRVNIVADESKFRDRAQLHGVSIGLMQLSHDMAQIYGCDEVTNADSLKDPRINLRCAVKMMNHLVKRDGVLRNDTNHVGSLFNGRHEDLTRIDWLGVSAFWSPLRFEYWRDRARISRPYINREHAQEKAADVERIRTSLASKSYCQE